jgi:hypothetical protein
MQSFGLLYHITVAGWAAENLEKAGIEGHGEKLSGVSRHRSAKKEGPMPRWARILAKPFEGHLTNGTYPIDQGMPRPGWKAGHALR